MERGIKRWAVNISQWNPTQDEFSFILSLLPLHERSSITRFVKFEDRKRAIVSRLLQYALVHEVFEIPFDEIRIKRTVEGKPYLEADGENMEFPNFNFNVSHHGDYVAIASEPLYIVGLDIVSLVIPKQETALEFVKNFSSYLTTFEWDNIVNAGTCNEILEEFYRYWCVKEAFIKAIGDGLGYKLDRLEFHHTNWTNIYVKIDGERSREWRFWISELAKNHWNSLFLGSNWSTKKYLVLTLQCIRSRLIHPVSGITLLLPHWEQMNHFLEVIPKSVLQHSHSNYVGPKASVCDSHYRSFTESFLLREEQNI